MQEGIQQGIEQGVQEGIQQGSLNSKIEIAKKMINFGYSIEDIKKITNLSVEIIKNL